MCLPSPTCATAFIALFPFALVSERTAFENAIIVEPVVALGFLLGSCVLAVSYNVVVFQSVSNAGRGRGERKSGLGGQPERGERERRAATTSLAFAHTSPRHAPPLDASLLSSPCPTALPHRLALLSYRYHVALPHRLTSSLTSSPYPTALLRQCATLMPSLCVSPLDASHSRVPSLPSAPPSSPTSR